MRLMTVLFTLSLLASAACSSSSSSSCEAAVRHVAALRGTPDDVPEAVAKCLREKWTATVRGCMARASSTTEATNCMTGRDTPVAAGPGATPTRLPSLSAGGALSATGTVRATTTTAILLDDVEGAPVLACSIGSKLVGSAWACSQEIKGDLGVASLDGAQRQLGKAKTIKCDPTESGDVIAKRAGFHLAASPRAHDSPLADFLVWPAARAKDVTVWNTSPSVDIAALTRRAAELAAALTRPAGDGADVAYAMNGAIEVRGALSADVDGDARDDAIYSIALPSDDAPFWQPRYLLASVSSRPGELLAVGSSTYSEIEAVGAIDLDGDGAAEVLVTEPYHEGSSSFVGRYKDGTIEPLGGWGCGL